VIVVDAPSLLPLLDEVAAFGVPGGVHPAVWSMDESTDAWGRRMSLIVGDPDSSALGRARLGRLAARIFPRVPRDRAELFARWLIWLFAFDDARDERPLGGSATAVDSRFTDLLKTLRRGHARPEADALELALAELWRETARGMSPAWRRRFLGHLEEQRAACTEEAMHRRTGHVPGPADYPALRRRTSGLFLLDLVEPVAGYELPEGVVRSPAWHALVQATADLVAWSNDVASYRQEAAAGTAGHNYLTVFAQAYGLGPEQTVTWVVNRIAERAPDAAAAARRLSAELTRLELAPEPAAQVTAVAEVLLTAPRAHLEWLQETGRYSAYVEPPPHREPLLVRAGVPGATATVPATRTPAAGPLGSAGPPGPRRPSRRNQPLDSIAI
jgi:hypothetical protein